MRINENQKYNELLKYINNGEDVVWLQNKINVNYKNKYITYQQREKLLKELESRH